MRREIYEWSRSRLVGLPTSIVTGVTDDWPPRLYAAVSDQYMLDSHRQLVTYLAGRHAKLTLGALGETDTQFRG